MPSKKGSKGSPKGSKDKSKGKSKGSKDSKGKSKGSKGSKGKSPQIIEIPPLVVPDVKRKLSWTGYDLCNYFFCNFRCCRCQLVLHSFQHFIAHCCWRKYYLAKFHLGNTQAFACRNCEMIFYSHGDYATHMCYTNKRCQDREYLEPEEVVPLTYLTHHDFYIDWTIRTEHENTPHDPDYDYICKCCNCNNRFKTKINFLIHSCCMFALLKPANIRRFTTCMHCKYVFMNRCQYDKHVKYCNQQKAFCIEFAAGISEIAAQQFVTGRHCFEFDYHLHSGACMKMRAIGEPPGGKPMPPKPIYPCADMEVCCEECGFMYSNLTEFYYHPCVAGKKITPINLELTLYCCDCHCLFPDVEECISHFSHCSSMRFAFVRINTPELLRVVLRRWSLQQADKVYLPSRQVKFKCDECNEVYVVWIDYLKHPCPRRERYERLFIQPMGTMETYTCEACHLVFFSVSEALAHSNCCKIGNHPHQFQIHYSMDEVIVALTPWMRAPALLEFDLLVGIGDNEDELALKDCEFMIQSAIPQKALIDRFHSEFEKPSNRIKDWILDTIDEKARLLEPHPPRLRDIAKDSCIRRMRRLKTKTLAENCDMYETDFPKYTHQKKFCEPGFHRNFNEEVIREPDFTEYYYEQNWHQPVCAGRKLPIKQVTAYECAHVEQRNKAHSYTQMYGLSASTLGREKCKNINICKECPCRSMRTAGCIEEVYYDKCVTSCNCLTTFGLNRWQDSYSMSQLHMGK